MMHLAAPSVKQFSLSCMVKNAFPTDEIAAEENAEQRKKQLYKNVHC